MTSNRIRLTNVVQSSLGFHGVVLLLGILAIAGVGCQQLKPTTPDIVATLSIRNGSLSAVSNAMDAVFAKREYRGGLTARGQYTYQRPGSTMDKLVYGDWIERKVIIKVVVTVREPDPGLISLSCDARLVSAPGDNVFQEDFKVSKSVRKECQEMLNEIQTIINQAPIAAPTAKPVTWDRTVRWPQTANSSRPPALATGSQRPYELHDNIGIAGVCKS